MDSAVSTDGHRPGSPARIGSWIAIAVIGILVTTAFLTQIGSIRSDPERQQASQAGYRRHSTEAMSTLVELLAPAGRDFEAATLVFDIFRDVDDRMSEWKAGSPLSALNRSAGGPGVVLPDDLRTLLERGLELNRETDGAFAVTWAALWGLWDFKAPQPRIPTDEEIAARRALVDDSRVHFDRSSGRVSLEQRGMMVGLGGIAKGHALDRAAAALREHGITSFLISAGGQVYAGGRRAERSWTVGVRDPRGAPDDYFAYLQVEDDSVSTSGDYERYFILDGVRYHHILDPRTGRPAHGLRSATVISADATRADALSTACMVLGPRRALTLIERLEGVEAVLVDENAEVRVTGGLQGRLHIAHPPRP